MNTSSRGWLGGLVIFLLLRVLESAAPALPAALGAGAARLAAAVLAVPLEAGPEPVLAHPDYPVQVVAACRGWNFLSLLAALLVARALGRGHGRAAALALPLAAAVTVLVNAGRLAAVSLAGRFVVPHLPGNAVVTFHTALGVAVFLPMLIVCYAVWERRLSHESERP